MSEISGIWESRYTYSGGESTHQVEVEDYDQTVFITSLPNDEDSTLKMELTRDDEELSGAWEEITSPTGEYKGTVFKGFVGFILNQEDTTAQGAWIGHNRDRTKINSGEWTLKKQPS